MSETFRIQGIPVGAISGFWAFAEPYIKRALDHTNGELSPADFLKSCENRDMQLWMIAKDSKIVGAATTEIVNYPQRKHCRIITVSGNEFDKWSSLFDETISKWAKEQGCNATEAFVRKGFVPKLTQLGYKHRYSAVFKEIES